MTEKKYLYFEVEEKELEPVDTNSDKVVKTYKELKQTGSSGDKYKYPYVMINMGAKPMFAIRVLKNSLIDHKFIDTGTPEGHYNVYIKQGNKSLLLGLVHSDNLKSVLLNQLYKDSEKYIMLDKDTKIEGDLMFGFCTSPHY